MKWFTKIESVLLTDITTFKHFQLCQIFIRNLSLYQISGKFLHLKPRMNLHSFRNSLYLLTILPSPHTRVIEQNLHDLKIIINHIILINLQSTTLLSLSDLLIQISEYQRLNVKKRKVWESVQLRLFITYNNDKDLHRLTKAKEREAQTLGSPKSWQKSPWNC